MFGKKTIPRLVGIDIQKNCIRYCTKKGDRLKYGELPSMRLPNAWDYAR